MTNGTQWADGTVSVFGGGGNARSFQCLDFNLINSESTFRLFHKNVIKGDQTLLPVIGKLNNLCLVFRMEFLLLWEKWFLNAAFKVDTQELV